MRLSLLLPFLAAWGGGMYGVLSIQRWQVSWAHVICGPWGCGPTAQSLIAYHGFWLLLLGGGAIFLGLQAPNHVRRTIGYALVFVGLLVLMAVGVRELWTWLPQTAAAHNRYLWQRYLFVVATTPDIPAVQGVLVGLGLVIAGPRPASAHHDAQAETQHTAGAAE